MKSNICKLDNRNSSISEILQEVEKVAVYNNLNEKQTNYLRLLSEESIGMLKGVLGFVRCSFYVECVNNMYKLHITSDVYIDDLTQDKFISLSKDNTNSAYKGFTGLMKRVADTFLNNPTSTAYAYESSTPYAMLMSDYSDNFQNIWSLNLYKETLDEDVNKEEWDELEHSIVASIADDVIIAATYNKLEMIIVKKF